VGTAARVGHDLTIEVTSWSGQLEVEEGRAAVSLDADGASLRVCEGKGGMKALDEDDRLNIQETIDTEVLRRASIEFRSTAAEFSADGNHLRVEGELALAGSRHRISFELTVAQRGRLMGRATITQSEWGIKPYSALFGALKVADDVEVTIDAELAPTT
jgi:polyisoprenoid-binding protein YceI